MKKQGQRLRYKTTTLFDFPRFSIFFLLIGRHLFSFCSCSIWLFVLPSFFSSDHYFRRATEYKYISIGRYRSKALEQEYPSDRNRHQLSCHTHCLAPHNIILVSRSQEFYTVLGFCNDQESDTDDACPLGYGSNGGSRFGWGKSCRGTVSDSSFGSIGIHPAVKIGRQTNKCSGLEVSIGASFVSE